QPASLQSGDLVVGDDVSGILQIKPDTGTQVIISQGGNLVNATGIAVASDRQILVVSGGGGAGGGVALPDVVLRVDVTTGTQTIVSSGGSLAGSDSFNPGLAIAGDGGILVTAATFTPGIASVVRIDPVTGTQKVVTAGGTLVQPAGIAVAPSGDIFVFGVGRVVAPLAPPPILRGKPVTGAQTRFPPLRFLG